MISKVIANRLKPFLPMLISLEQSGYVEGRQILDGIILSHEIIHSLKHSKQVGMILKLDLSKDFDKLNWLYIQKMLSSFGFSPMWLRWVMSLISSSFFSILINRIPSRPFKPSRGIIQGDPLSPFLFVLMAEGLGRHIKQALLSKRLKEASGTNINTAKSQIYFFHTPPVTQFAIARILGFTIDSLPSKYLGAPLIASALKHASWHILLEKLESRLNLWTHRTLNISSRLVLIKAVL
eukprot:PITA_33499